MSDDTNEDSSISLSPASDSGWDEILGFLCRQLQASENSDDARERFFLGYQKLCRGVAVRLLGGWKWKGDIRRDAEDIASESVKILLTQEARSSGVFGSRAKKSAHLRGYLSRTIWRSCVQIAMRMQPKMILLSLDQLLDAGEDFGIERLRSRQEMRAELTEILAILETGRIIYRQLPDEVNLLDCLLAAEFGHGGIEGIKKRTLQRYVSQIRNLLKRQLAADVP